MAAADYQNVYGLLGKEVCLVDEDTIVYAVSSFGVKAEVSIILLNDTVTPILAKISISSTPDLLIRSDKVESSIALLPGQTYIRNSNQLGPGESVVITMLEGECVCRVEGTEFRKSSSLRGMT